VFSGHAASQPASMAPATERETLTPCGVCAVLEREGDGATWMDGRLLLAVAGQCGWRTRPEWPEHVASTHCASASDRSRTKPMMMNRQIGDEAVRLFGVLLLFSIPWCRNLLPRNADKVSERCISISITICARTSTRSGSTWPRGRKRRRRNARPA
jgi:hypothetical protein